MTTYEDFLASKALSDPMTGLKIIPPLPACLFPFQADIVRWALRRGRAALFAGTGLGKSLMELSWAQAVHQSTGRNVLLLTPLAVAAQMIREAGKFGIVARQASQQSEVLPGITVTNYQKLNRFDVASFGGIILDESSILKNETGATRNALIQEVQSIPFRLAATATPAPNDFMELGSHAEFLSVMSYTDMLACFFTHDGSETQKWRLKGHAETAFWKWMASWGVMLRKPSDLGYEDGSFSLPPLVTHQHMVGVEYAPSMETGMLFPMQAETLQERIRARRDTVSVRVAAAAALVNGNDRPWVCWGNLNAETEAMTRAIPGAIEVRGSDPEDVKERRLDDFSQGKFRVLVTKGSIAGWGMNWQHCRDTVLVGMNDSWEMVFQIVRRFWRYGQTETVNAHFIASEIEGAVVANIRRKDADADRMASAMVAQMADLSSEQIHGQTRDRADYVPAKRLVLPSFLQKVS